MARTIPADRRAEPAPGGRLRRHGARLRARSPGPRLHRPDAPRPGLPPADGRAARPGLAGGDADRRHGARSRGGRGLPAQPLDHLPGAEAGRALQHRDRPAGRGAAPQHPLHRRRRPPAPAQPRQPGLHAARRRPLAAVHAHLPRAALGRGARRRALRVRRGVRQALPVAGHRDGHGRAPERRPAAAPLVQLDPEAVRRRGAHEASASSSRRPSSSSTTTPTASSPPAATTPATTSSRRSWPPRPTAIACPRSSA